MPPIHLWIDDIGIPNFRFDKNLLQKFECVLTAFQF